MLIGLVVRQSSGAYLLCHALSTIAYAMTGTCCCIQNIQVHYSNHSSPKADTGLLSRPELEQMIKWETNNLYEYLKDLYDQQYADLADYNR